ANVAVIEDDRILDYGAGVHADAAAEHGISDEASGQNAATGDDGIDRLAAPAFIIERKLGGRIRVTDGPHGPLAIVEVQRRVNGSQVHIGVIVGVDGAYVAPV